ncbi:hypothetical protein CH276_22670 [Rhodococcus sp. 06-470-2]|uniref:hypothetical protein n=1 Tax=unclassified Rhodococcus (in: high G+C Gram-positive bacteria) TaxID=192944 RepID=UPI000B9B4BCD|nr:MULTISPECIES: hypothetical protein [unclassified Rhodococcus (in: high G+C Gram-positive bacteria)]OZC59254.1 hypothetical protein CH276_22670 [Rhodococcus sp. 06-470-2]OZE66841.1 hypothetical protein CH265_07995 [Rhodococcus sp. 05-2221-1B]
MSDPTADAYRLAADYLAANDGSHASIARLRVAANRLDDEYSLAAELGNTLMTEAASGCGPLALGQRAIVLVGQHYRLEPLPVVMEAGVDE